MVTARGVIRRRALRLVQDPKHPLYLFALKASELLVVADISRVSRDDSGDLIGYQRPEVKRHVRNITEYLDAAGSPLFPHALILAIDSTTTFKGSRGPRIDDDVAEAGTLTFRLPRRGGSKPAWIVDGQQRALALSRSRRRDLSVPIAAFVADDVDTQRDQFVLINTSKPLPKGLISELLPKVSSHLPASLAAKRAPAALCEVLATIPESPFCGLVKRSSESKDTRRGQVVTDTALIHALSDNLSPSGCLFAYRDVATGETDFEAVQRVLLVFWTMVKRTFPEAWGKPATQSRLMHGVGIRAMGHLMDRMMGSINVDAPDALERVRTELASIKPYCAWTSGEWEGLGRRWNELENTSTHINLLSNYLMRAYLTARRDER
jgi:DGQHR domain-containing protein